MRVLEVPQTLSVAGDMRVSLPVHLVHSDEVNRDQRGRDDFGFVARANAGHVAPQPDQIAGGGFEVAAIVRDQHASEEGQPGGIPGPSVAIPQIQPAPGAQQFIPKDTVGHIPPPPLDQERGLRRGLARTHRASGRSSG